MPHNDDDGTAELPHVVQIRLPDGLVKRLDSYRLGMALRPTRSQVIRFLVEHALNIAEEGEGDGKAVAAFRGEIRKLRVFK